MTPAPVYKAFISYSHAADAKFAPALQRALEQFSSRWYERRAIHVFRDQTDLSASPQLWPTIERALAQAEFFLLLASPQAATSKWVAREVEFWLTHRSADSIIIILTQGEIVWDDDRKSFDRTATTALPPALYDQYPVEPFVIDFRWAQRVEAVALTDDAYRDAVGTIAATLHGVAKSALVGKDLHEYKRRLALARMAVITVLLLLAASVAATVAALLQRQTARAERDRAMARELATLAADSLTTDPERTLILALHSRALAPGAASTLPQLLHDALLTSPVRVTYRLDGRPVDSVRWSPTGDRIVSSHGLNGLRIWSAHDGRPIATREGWRGGWSADGRHLTGIVKHSFVLDPLDGGEVRRIPLASDVGPYVLSPDGRRLAVAMGQDIQIVDAVSGAAVSNIIRRPHPDEAVITTIDWHPQLPQVLVGTDAAYEIWDLSRLDQPVMRRSRPGLVDAARWSPDGQSIATQELGPGEISRVRVESPRSDPVDVPLPFIARDMQWSHDGRSIAAVGIRGAIVIVSVERKAVEFQRVGHTHDVASVSWSPDDSRIATASEDGTVKIWQIRHVGEAGGLWTGAAHVADYSPATRRLASAGVLFPTVSLWDVARGTPLPALGGSQVHGGLPAGQDVQLEAFVFTRIGGVKWSPSGNRLAVSGIRTNPRNANATVHTEVWAWDGKAPAYTFAEKSALAWSPGGLQLVFQTRQGIEIQPLNESAAPRTHPIPGSIRDAAWSPTSHTVALATADGLTLLDSRTGTIRTVAVGDPPCALAWSPDGEQVAVRSERGITVVSVASLESVRYDVMPGGSCHLAWSPRGTLLASAAAGGVGVWSAADGRPVATLRTARLAALSWEQAGHHLTAVDEAGRLTTWETDETNLYRIAHDRVTRPLRVDECQRYFAATQCPPLPPRP